MASVLKRFKHDVFLSFRGEDTRKNFVDHLYHALEQKGVITYKDDEKIEKGERISDQLIRSIEDSRFHIIVFSKNYASSSWCLDELVKITECQKTMEHTAYPIFYDVEPTEVRNQTGAIGEAFAKHVDEEAAMRWRDALKEVASLAGWELKNTVDGHEAKLIQRVVIEILLKRSFIDSSADENLVGMSTRVKSVVSSLEIGIEDVRMIGIKGMGGGGKTTLATAVFDQISMWFEGTSFVENVREVSKSSLSGLKELQEQVLSNVLDDRSIVVKSVSDGKNKIKRMIGSRTVLVVLDDVDDIDQLEALAGKPNWFKPGSRIIITTRDEQVLVAHRVNFIHDVKMLSHEEAICLFSRYAFAREIPNQGYEELSEKVVHYAAGLPLTIKVLGSYLCGRIEREWEDAIKRLKTIPLKQTLEKLELSYNGLENDQKEIFLEIACILKGKKKKAAIEILESFGFCVEIGLKVLEQKSLITICDDDTLLLHDHLEEMGMNIVRRLHPEDPNQHTRLWIKNEIEYILINDLGTKATRSVKLEYTNLHIGIIMKGLKKMTNLRSHYVEYGAVKSDDVVPYLPNTLQSLHWRGYPLGCLPKTFLTNNLVNLKIERSNITQLWEGGERKVLHNLRFLYLGHSKLRNFDLRMTPHLQTLDLKECPDFIELNMLEGCLHLEALNLEGCYQFVEFNISVVCSKLKVLKLGGSNLSSLNLGMTPNLESLCLDIMSPLFDISMPIELPNLKYLNLNHSNVSNLNLGLTPNLKELFVKECHDFVELHMPVTCSKLKHLNLSYSKLSCLNLITTPNLEELYIEECYDFAELHMPIECPRLKYLSLSYSKVINLNLGLTPNIEGLTIKGCYDFAKLHMPVECAKLKYLCLSDSKVRNLNLGLTPNIEGLTIESCYDLGELHMPVECSKLKCLKVNGSNVSDLNLGLTPILETLDLTGCTNFQKLHMPVECPKLKSVILSGTKMRSLYLRQAPHLEILDLGGCNDFVELHMSVECPNLEFLNLSGSKVSEINLGLTPHLKRLVLTKCYRLQVIHAPMGCLKNLVFLDLRGCLRFEYFFVDKGIQLLQFNSLAELDLRAKPLDMCPLHPDNNFPKFQFNCTYDYFRLGSLAMPAPTPKFLDENNDFPKFQFESIYDKPLSLSSNNLEKLISFGLCACTNLETFTTSICSLQRLGKLTLEGSFSEAPKDMWQLESLEELTLLMKEIKHLPDSICKLKHLKYLNLESCWLLEQLSMDLGQLECLEELHLIDCVSLQDIPNSICKMKSLRYLDLRYCIQVEKLPRELGCLERLTKLDIEGAGILRLPQSIFQLKDLCMYGSKWQLELYGFTMLVNISKYTAFCYIRDYNMNLLNELKR